MTKRFGLYLLHGNGGSQFASERPCGEDLCPREFSHLDSTIPMPAGWQTLGMNISLLRVSLFLPLSNVLSRSVSENRSFDTGLASCLLQRTPCHFVRGASVMPPSFNGIPDGSDGCETAHRTMQ
jgi:hypothetical protein